MYHNNISIVLVASVSKPKDKWDDLAFKILKICTDNDSGFTIKEDARGGGPKRITDEGHCWRLGDPQLYDYFCYRLLPPNNTITNLESVIIAEIINLIKANPEFSLKQIRLSLYDF